MTRIQLLHGDEKCVKSSLDSRICSSFRTLIPIGILYPNSLRSAKYEMF